MKPDVWNNNDLHPKHNYVLSPKTKTHVDREVSQAIILWGFVRDRNSKTRKAEEEDKKKRACHYCDKTGKNKYLGEQGLGQRPDPVCKEIIFCQIPHEFKGAVPHAFFVIIQHFTQTTWLPHPSLLAKEQQYPELWLTSQVRYAKHLNYRTFRVCAHTHHLMSEFNSDCILSMGVYFND